MVVLIVLAVSTVDCVTLFVDPGAMEPVLRSSNGGSRSALDSGLFPTAKGNVSEICSKSKAYVPSGDFSLTKAAITSS